MSLQATVKQIFKRRELVVYLVLVIAFLAFYLLFRSNSFDDWDSIQFAMGIKDFDLLAEQPHAPGYPVYIFILKMVNLVINDPLQSMLFVSSLFGAVGVGIFFLILSTIYKKRIGVSIFGALLLGLFPLYSLNSVKAMSDIPAVATYLMWLSAYLGITESKEEKKRLLWFILLLGVLSGLLIGIRIQLIVLIIIPLVGLLWKCIKGNRWLEFGVLSASGVVSTLAWLVPTIIDTGGFKPFVDVMVGRYTWRYSINAHTPFQYGIFNLYYYIEHGISHIYSLIRGGFGISMPYYHVNEMPTGLFWVIAMVCILLIGILFYGVCRKRKNRYVRLFAISALPYALFMYVNLNYENPRYWLPLVVWMVFWFVYLVIRFKNLIIQQILLSLVCLFGLYQSVVLLTIVHTQKSPPTQAVEYFEANYDISNLVFLDCSHMNGRHFQYLPSVNVPFYDEYSQEDIVTLKGQTFISCQCWNSQLKLPDYSVANIQEFYRDIRVHWKHSYLEICELKNGN